MSSNFFEDIYERHAAPLRNQPAPTTPGLQLAHRKLYNAHLQLLIRELIALEEEMISQTPGDEWNIFFEGSANIKRFVKEFF